MDITRVADGASAGRVDDAFACRGPRTHRDADRGGATIDSLARSVLHLRGIAVDDAAVALTARMGRRAARQRVSHRPGDECDRDLGGLQSLRPRIATQLRRSRAHGDAEHRARGDQRIRPHRRGLWLRVPGAL